MTGNTLK